MPKKHISPSTGLLDDCTAGSGKNPRGCPFTDSNSHMSVDSGEMSAESLANWEHQRRIELIKKGEDLSHRTIDPPGLWQKKALSRSPKVRAEYEERIQDFLKTQNTLIQAEQKEREDRGMETKESGTRGIQGFSTLKRSKTNAEKVEELDPSEENIPIQRTEGFTALDNLTDEQLSTPNKDVNPEAMKDLLKKRGEVTHRLVAETNEAWTNFREAESFTQEKNDAKHQGIALVDETKQYRHKTANLVEKMDNSFGFSDLTQWEHDTIGDSVKTTGYEPSSREWLEERLDSIGGSDVGVLAVEYLVPDEEKAPYHASGFTRVKRSKLKVDEGTVQKQTEGSAPANPEDADNIGYNPKAEATPLYFGNASEAYIAKSFERDRGDQYNVYEAKDQYVNKDRSFQKVNVDGILEDKETGKMGILEIKNIGAKPDPPEADADGYSDPDKDLSVNYRAQVLYYLNSTGYDYGVVRIRYNDNEFRDFNIDKDDDVVPGTGVKMEEFINDYVEPFYQRSKKFREAFNRHSN